MNQDEHNDLVAILAEAQAIVEEGLGALSSSTMRDHILEHLCVALLGDWFERREKAAKTRDLPLRPSTAQKFLEEVAALMGVARDIAVSLQKDRETKEADNGAQQGG